jgi:hypothetical protein
MPMRVAKNTFMYEPVSDDVLVRRAVFAGQLVPEHYIAGDDTEDGAVEVDGAGAPMVGFGAAAANYKHNVGVPIAEQEARLPKSKGRKPDTTPSTSGSNMGTGEPQNGA